MTTKIVAWAKASDGKFSFDSVYSRYRLKSFLDRYKGEWVKLTVESKSRPKSDELLGFYWGGVLPCFVGHNKSILTQAMVDHNPLILGQLIHEKKITNDDIEKAHETLMTEFRPRIIQRLDGTTERQRGEMKKMNSTTAIEYITEVVGYMVENGYPVPATDAYKRARDMVQLTSEQGSETL